MVYFPRQSEWNIEQHRWQGKPNYFYGSVVEQKTIKNKYGMRVNETVTQEQNQS